MIVFDFDKTLYRKDSLTAFHRFVIRKDPRVLRWLPLQLCGAVLYLLRITDTQTFKNLYLCFLTGFSEEQITRLAELFWNQEFPGQFNTTLLQKVNRNALIITASPELYLFPLMPYLGNPQLIGTRLIREGHRYTIDGKNCKGDEKVSRLRLAFPAAVVDEVYSDSYADQPLFDLASHAFLVRSKITRIK
jgi:phosphoserine phosphatase